MAYYLIHHARVDYVKFIYDDLINRINTKKRKNIPYTSFVTLIIRNPFDSHYNAVEKVDFFPQILVRPP